MQRFCAPSAWTREMRVVRLVFRLHSSDFLSISNLLVQALHLRCKAIQIQHRLVEGRLLLNECHAEDKKFAIRGL